MVRIIGDGIIPEAAAFCDVRDALSDFDREIVLGAHIAPAFGMKVEGTVIYNLEPLYDGCRSLSVGYMETLKRNCVLDYSENNVRYLKHHGIEAFHMPYGYHDSLERAKEAVKDIDVLCVGSINPRRKAIFDRMPKEVRFVWAQGVYGSALDELIARAKVHVNVHFCDCHPLEVVRLNYLMANGGTVVSEKGNEEDVNLQYEGGLIFARYDEIIEACEKALASPKDGRDCIRKLPHDCESAKKWISRHGY